MDDFRKPLFYAAVTIAVASASTALAAPPGERRAADIVGTEVLDATGRLIGTVREVMVDMYGGGVAYVLAAADAPLQPGDRAVRVDSDKLRPAYRGDRFVLLLPPGDMSRLQTFEAPADTR